MLPPEGPIGSSGRFFQSGKVVQPSDHCSEQSMSSPAANAFDLHLHTTRHSPDGEMNPFALARKVRHLGLAGIVITEHDWLWTTGELEELRAVTPRVQIYAGIEVSAAEGHFLVYGVRDPLRFPKQIRLSDLCQEARRQGAAVVAAHPYRWGQNFDALVQQQGADLDGLEVLSLNMDQAARTKASCIWKEKKWAGLASSDAHRLEDVGYGITEFTSAIRDLPDLVEAIRCGDGRPRSRLDLELRPPAATAPAENV
jgi:predicted metal-dependent phosphoesterase TrpH